MPDVAAEILPIANREEWLRWRTGLLTASRIAALFDRHPFLPYDDLAADVQGRRLRDAPNLRAGRILEAAIDASLAEDQPDWIIRPAGTFHVARKWRLGCTPDRLLDDDGLLQYKTVFPREWEAWRGRLPLWIILQVLLEAMLTGKRRLYVPVMVRSSELPLYLFTVPRNERAEQRILDAAAIWWHQFDAGDVGLPLDAYELAQLVDDGSSVDLSADNRLPALLAELSELKGTAEETKVRIDEIEEEIREKMGRAKVGWLNGWSIKLPTISRKAYEVPASTYRRLTIARTDDA